MTVVKISGSGPLARSMIEINGFFAMSSNTLQQLFSSTLGYKNYQRYLLSILEDRLYLCNSRVSKVPVIEVFYRDIVEVDAELSRTKCYMHQLEVASRSNVDSNTSEGKKNPVSRFLFGSSDGSMSKYVDTASVHLDGWDVTIRLESGDILSFRYSLSLVLFEIYFLTHFDIFSIVF